MRAPTFVRRIQDPRASSATRRPRSTIAMQIGLVAIALGVASTGAASAAVPGLERAVDTSDSDTFAIKKEDAPCPPGKRLVGTGGDITGGLGAVGMTLTPEPFSTEVFAVENPTGTNGNWFINAYSICADPLPGLQIVEAVGPSSSKNKHMTAKCPPGKRLVGAGGNVTDQSRVVMPALEPDPELTKVLVRGAEGQGGTDFDWLIRAYAVCANPLPGLQLVHEPGPLSSGPSSFARARCPAGKAVVGTGGEIKAGPSGLPVAGQVVLDDLTPNAQLTQVTVTAFEDQDGTDGDWRVHAYAICATK
jgi:hypothetical protein